MNGDAADKHSILVVDDIESIRYSIKDYLAREFRTFAAADGFEAARICKNEKIDLVITDIRMPGMGGLQLIKLLRQSHPDMQFALMTAYSVDDYIAFVRNERVWNIIPKSTAMDLRFILVMARKLLTKEIFGIEQYFPGTVAEPLSISDIHRLHRRLPEEKLDVDHFYVCRVTTPEENHAICDMAGDLLIESGAPSMVRLVLEELAANAMIHAPRRDREEVRERERVSGIARPGTAPGEYQPMADEDAFDVSFGVLGDNAVVSITDYHGTMDREEILYRLERQVTPDPETGLPLGLVDTHGRGLYISREQADQLIFNISPGEKTEIIGILPTEPGMRNRAISIFQAEP